MKIECSKCGDTVETTAKTVVAPFVCNECDCGTCKPDTTPTPTFVPISDSSTGHTSTDWESNNSDKLFDYLFSRVSDFDLRAVFSRLNKEIPTLALDKQSDPCDTASVENTTLLIEDLQQQLQDERAVVVALEGQVQNQADLIKQQEGHIDQDLTTIAGLLKDRSRLAAQAEALGKEKFEINRAAAWLLGAWFALIEENDKLVSQAKCLDDRCNRQHKSIALYQEQEVKLQGQVTFWKAMTEKWTRRAEGALDLAIARKGIIADLKRHPIREYFRNAWSS
jgi:hypothetical protein